VDDTTRNTMVSNDSISENSCRSFRVKFEVGGFKFNCFSDPVNNSKNGVISLTFWKRAYKVDSDNFPGLSWWFKGMKRGFCRNPTRFSSLTCLTSRGVSFNVMMNSWPPVVTEDILDGLELSVMS